MDLSHRLELLRCTRLLRTAPESLLQELAEGCEGMSFAEGEVLFEACDGGLADRSASILGKRCREMHTQSLDAWDGVFTLSNK